MSETAVTSPEQARRAAARRRSLALMFGCTILGAVGQILIKLGANTLGQNASPWAMVTNPPIFIGYVLYGLMTVLFVFALRGEELSILYPIISLNYVWVAGLSVFFFRESLGWARTLGIVTIVVGVAVLGRDGKR